MRIGVAKEIKPQEYRVALTPAGARELVLHGHEVVVAWPDEVDTAGWQEACAGLPLAHMGRGPADDATFFRSAFAAGVVARGLMQ